MISDVLGTPAKGVSYWTGSAESEGVGGNGSGVVSSFLQEEMKTRKNATGNKNLANRTIRL
jgi:hypothetical protein